MAVSDLFRRAKQALFSAPTPERQLLKLVKASQVRRVAELGVESLDGTAQLLKQLTQKAPSEAVSYTGFDLFDERCSDQERLSLIEAHRELSATGAKVRLQPGGPTAGVSLLANALQDTDLVLISQLATDDLLTSIWFYLPRMCHPGTLVLKRLPEVEGENLGGWSPVALAEVNRLAGLATMRRAA